MKKHEKLTQARIENFLVRLKGLYYPHRIPFDVSYYKTEEPVDFNRQKEAIFVPIETGAKWGGAFDCAWFKLKGKIPSSFKGREVVALIDVGGEACVFDKSGNPVQGLTNKRIGQEFDEAEIKRRVYLTKNARGDEYLELLLDAGANNIMGVSDLHNGLVIADGTLNQAEIAVFDREIWNLYMDYEFLFNLQAILNPKSRHRKLINYALNEVVNEYGNGDGDSVRLCRGILAKELKKHANASAIAVSAIGHAHIDIAWLWPLRETTRKAARSFSTALKMMEEYEDYKFGASQPYLYEKIKADYPGLYRRIKNAIHAKKWECQGGMYVEADCNVTGGESLVRQLLYGKRFFKDEFDVDVDNLWLPDVFGYSAALPQLLIKSGIRFFMTQKISWNQFNRFPHHTFFWKGLDGTSIFTHFLSNNTYNSTCNPENLVLFELENLDTERTEHALLLYGVGDGGGGPDRKHIERLRRAGDIEDLPRVTMEFARDFFRKLEGSAKDLQLWEGELYLEYHRGTLTSQARVKKRNRQLEIFIREIEYLYSFYDSDNYPQQAIESAWKTILLNQFHDIIPGSSINRVYKECHEDYDRVEAALLQLMKDLGRSHQPELQDEECVLISNSLSWDREDIMEMEGGTALAWMSAGGFPVPVQRITKDNREALLLKVSVPSMGYAVFKAGNGAATSEVDSLSVTDSSLENNLLRILLNPDGYIDSIYDKECEREILSGQGNVLNLYEDIPVTYEAWDVDIFYEETKPSRPVLKRREITEKGPVRASLKQYFEGGDYSVSQVISLYHDSRRVEFDTTVDWKMARKMLRVEFPVAIKALQAAYEIQYGHVFRNTHYNTTWDMAQFEVVAHKWADLSQSNYGVAIINDSKYGHKIKGNTISLNLLRSPKSPDPEADMHVHHFRYALFPHEGNHLEGGVIREAYNFNVPLRVMPVFKPRAASHSFVRVDGANVVIESVKKAEDSKDLIVRLYESHGIDSPVVVSLGFPIRGSWLTDLMENEIRELQVTNSESVSLHFRPFEIHTLKIRFFKSPCI